MARRRRSRVQRTATDVGSLIGVGAEEVVRLTDPYVLASYYIEQELPGPEFPKTTETLKHVMETRPDEMPWACNLQGLLLLNRHETSRGAGRAAARLRSGPAAAKPRVRGIHDGAGPQRAGRTRRCASSTRRGDAAPLGDAADAHRLVQRHAGSPPHCLPSLPPRRRDASRSRLRDARARGVHVATPSIPRSVAALEVYFRLRGPGWTGVNPTSARCSTWAVSTMPCARPKSSMRAIPTNPRRSATLARIRLQQGRRRRSRDAGRSRHPALVAALAQLVLLGRGVAGARRSGGRDREIPAALRSGNSVPECVTGGRAPSSTRSQRRGAREIRRGGKDRPGNARNYLHWGEALRRIGRTADGDAMVAKAHKLAAKRQHLLL